MLATTFSVFIIFSAILYRVESSPSITSPLGSNWQAGTTQTITWIDNQDKKEMPEYADLYLMAGKITALQPVGNIATNITTKPGQYKWEIPKETPSGKDYAIRIGSPPDIYYSPYFEISGGTGARPDSGKETTYSDVDASKSDTTENNSGKQPSASLPSDNSTNGKPGSKNETDHIHFSGFITTMIGVLGVYMNCH